MKLFTRGRGFFACTHNWTGGVVDPQGFSKYREFFALREQKPVWTYALADALLEKRVWMRQGENTTYIQYTLWRANGPIKHRAENPRQLPDFHSSTHAGDWHMQVAPSSMALMILPFDGATPFYLRSTEASCEPRHDCIAVVICQKRLPAA